MAIHIKRGVEWRKVQPQTLLALQIANECAEENGLDIMVTSVTRFGSWLQVLLHGSGLAIDVVPVKSLRMTPPGGDMTGAWSNIIESLHRRIGKRDGGQFDVVDERQAGSSDGWTGSHIHLEFDPKENLA